MWNALQKYKAFLPNRSLLEINTTLGQIHLRKRHNLCAENELVSNVKHKEQNDTDVACEKVARVPVDENGKTAGNEDQDAEEDAVVRQVRLEGCLVREALAGDALRLQSLHESHVAEADECPADEAGDGDDVEEPVEDNRSVLREVQESEKTECR